MVLSPILVASCFTALALGAPTTDHVLQKRWDAYAPVPATCPSTTLVRPASSGIGNSEQAWYTLRKAKADAALRSWLSKAGFTATATKYPSVGLTVSGGGYRSMLEGAGVVQAFDLRDSKLVTAGLYQALTYQGGLSGGSFLLGALSANNYPTISNIVSGLWNAALANGIFEPGGAFGQLLDDPRIIADIEAKNLAGFRPTLTDAWGRLLSYQLFYGADGGVIDKLSGITGLSSFQSYSVPYPIITSIETAPGQCLPVDGSPQFELHPFEFGSWDSGIAAFTQSKYLGTNLTNGVPTWTNKCITGYDNMGYVVGTSSSLFSEDCTSGVPDSMNELLQALEALLSTDVFDSERIEFAVYPNPFYKYTGSSGVNTETELHLVDGGTSNQNNPIWPFIQPARSGVIDVLIVNDNSADTVDNWPNGTEIYHTYVQAQDRGLTRMPVIPPVSTFVAEGLNKRATFFGCNDANKLTIVYLPNNEYTYASNVPTAQETYSSDEIADMIGNGNAIATQNGTSGWSTCLSCAIMQKSDATLPSACTACFAQYCFTS